MRIAGFLVAGALAAALLLFNAVADDRVPNAIAERRRFYLDRSTRVSLFDNRMAVATVSEKGRQVYFRQLTLPEGEFEIYLRAIEEVFESAGRGSRARLRSMERDAVITLDLPGHEPRTIVYSPLGVQDIHTARLIAVLDDIEMRAGGAGPSQEALRTWQPKRGDRVELFTGVGATVIEVRQDGIIVLEHDGTGVLEVIPPDQRHTVIQRLLR